MPVFQFVALDSQGVEIKDTIEALSEKEAISKIRNLGYFPTKVRSRGAEKKPTARAAAQAGRKRGTGGKVRVKLITQFARQLSTLQDAGLPILRSLRILEEQQKAGTFKRVVGGVADDIEGGSTLSEALGRYPRSFNRLFVNMVAAGETGGVLDLILSRVADFMEKAQKLKSRVRSAMVYPILVLTAAFTILLLLMKYVIPKFIEVLDEMLQGQKPNVITRTVLGVSDWIAYHGGWAILLGVPVGFIFLLKALKQFRGGRLVVDTVKLKLPVIGQLSSKIAVTRWTRTLGTLISAGVPILDAINVTRETAGNEVFSNMLGDVHDSIRQGDTFASPLRKSKTVDLIVSNMVSVGEETGDLDKMLMKVADNYDEQVDVLVASLMSMLEPIMILVLGGIVLVIVLAIFMPMIQVISGLSGGGV
ncbi:MAG TPA: type II secretion system F family protein [Sedimentisphaerales bacterium]|nr:type II secretion system F family protein [Sedimentisphaerales bacterium]